MHKAAAACPLPSGWIEVDGGHLSSASSVSGPVAWGKYFYVDVSTPASSDNGSGGCLAGSTAKVEKTVYGFSVDGSSGDCREACGAVCCLGEGPCQGPCLAAGVSVSGS